MAYAYKNSTGEIEIAGARNILGLHGRRGRREERSDGKKIRRFTQGVLIMRRKTWRPASRRRVGFINFQAGVSNWLPNILFMNRADFQGRGDREETLLSLSLSPLITLVKFHLRSSRHLPFVFFSFLFNFGWCSSARIRGRAIKEVRGGRGRHSWRGDA